MKVMQLLPELISGGVERGTLEISQALVKAGHESIVVSHGGKLVDQLEQEGGKHHCLPVHKKSLTSLLQVKTLRALIEKEGVDLIHARSRVPAWISYLAWKGMNPQTRPRFITTFHGFHSVSPYSAIMTKGERVIAVSEAVKEHIKENYPRTDLEKVTVIHRGVNDDLSPVTSPEALRLKKEAAGKFLLTLPGRLTQWKGGKDFLQIIHALKAKGIPVHGWLAGGAHEKREGFLRSLNEMATSLEIQEDVQFLGHRTDLRDILSLSDVVLSLSTKPEAFGRVSLEALRQYIPVLGYNHGGVAEQLAALFPEGAVPVGNISSCVEKLESWYKQVPVLEKKENPFSLDKMKSSVLEVYSALVPTEK